VGTLQNSADKGRPRRFHRSGVAVPLSHSHAVRFYSQKRALITHVCDFLAPFLQRRNSAIAIATAPHCLALAERLQAAGLDPLRLAEEGKLIVLDAHETMARIMVDGRPDPGRFRSTIVPLLQQAAAGSDEGAVAVFGEIVALLCAQSNYKAAIRLEQLWNGLLREHSFSLLCAYPMTLFDSRKHRQAFRQVCREHSQVVPEETYPAAGDDADRLRSVALLQQRARALESEAQNRKQMEQMLRRAHQKVGRQTKILQTANHCLHELAARLLRLQEAERKRIARDLNENTNQKLAILSMNISVLQAEISLDRPDITGKLQRLRDDVHQISAELRTLSYVLHPPLLNEMGLESALRWYVEVFGQQSGISVNLQMARDLGRLSDAAEIAIFRLVQECLADVQRHRSSTTPHISVCRAKEHVQLLIRDEGRGIAPEKPSALESWVPSLGVRGMRERVADLGGKLEVLTHNNGTQVNVIIPNQSASA